MSLLNFASEADIGEGIDSRTGLTLPFNLRISP